LFGYQQDITIYIHALQASDCLGGRNICISAGNPDIKLQGREPQYYLRASVEKIVPELMKVSKHFYYGNLTEIFDPAIPNLWPGRY
jgi:hypothetical protein